MERWTALVALLNESPVTPRIALSQIVDVIETGRWTKAERPKVDALQGELLTLLQTWRGEDRESE